jgi:predicted porin
MKKLIFAIMVAVITGAAGVANAQSNVTTLGDNEPLLRAEGDDAQAALAATGVITPGPEPWREAVDLAASKARTASVAFSGSIYGGIGIGLGKKTTANTGGGRFTLGGPSSLMLSGLEEMGGPNQVFFKLEQDVNAKTGETGGGTSSFFNKQAYLAIRGAWGTLHGGRVYTPYFSTQALVADPSGSYALLSSSNIMETTGARLNNGIIYTLPGTYDVFTLKRFPGFSAAVAHYFGDNTAGASKGAANGLKVGWLSGDSKFRIEGAMHRQNTYTAGAVDNDKTSWLLGSFYDFDFGRVHLAYATSKRKDNLANGAIMEHFQEYMTGVNMPLGPGRLMVTVIRKMFNHDDPRGLKNRWQFGTNYDYILSKRTKITFGAVLNTNSGSTIEYAANTNAYAGASASGGRQAAITIGLGTIF